MASVRSITPIDNHHSMSRNLNEKSRYSLPVNSNEMNQLDDEVTEDNNEEKCILSPIEFVPDRHSQLIKELKGNKNKPSILTKYKSISNLLNGSASKAGNLTERSLNAKKSSQDKNYVTSTDYSEKNLNLDILPKVTTPNIFELKMQIPKTQKQKELFRRSQNVSLPQLSKNQN